MIPYKAEKGITASINVTRFLCLVHSHDTTKRSQGMDIASTKENKGHCMLLIGANGKYKDKGGWNGKCTVVD